MIYHILNFSFTIALHDIHALQQTQIGLNLCRIQVQDLLVFQCLRSGTYLSISATSRDMKTKTTRIALGEHLCVIPCGLNA